MPIAEQQPKQNFLSRRKMLKATAAALAGLAIAAVSLEKAFAVTPTPTPRKRKELTPPTKTPAPKTPQPTRPPATVKVQKQGETLVTSKTSVERINLLLKLPTQEQQSALKDLLAKEGISAVIDASTGVFNRDVRNWIAQRMWEEREKGNPRMYKPTVGQREWCAKYKIHPETLANIMDVMAYIAKYFPTNLPSPGMFAKLMQTETGFGSGPNPAGTYIGGPTAMSQLKNESWKQNLVNYIASLNKATGLKYDAYSVIGSGGGGAIGPQLMPFNLSKTEFRKGANPFSLFGPEADGLVMAFKYLTLVRYKPNLSRGNLYRVLWGWNRSVSQVNAVCDAEMAWRVLPEIDKLIPNI